MYNVNDSAVVVEDAKTGEILAMDGSANYKNSQPKVSGQVNAALAYRQPGSSIKPLVYATALQQGWYPGIKLVDDRTYVPDGGSSTNGALDASYTPYDYNKSYHPNLPTDMRISLQNSFNVPAVKALMYSGLDNVINMARRLGITSIDEQTAAYNAAHPYGHPDTAAQIYGPSFALGTAGIPLVQMVGAYQTFANNGQRVPQHNILDIFDNYGRILYHYNTAHPRSEVVLSPQVNFLLTDMLSDNFSRHYEFGGTDTLVMTDWGDNHPVAAKTGTTDDFLDNWTLGFTSSIVVGVWSGNADGLDPMQGVIGLTGAGNIWHDVIEYASGRSLLGMHPDVHYPTNAFLRPTGVVQTRVNAINGLKGDSVQDWVIDGEQPQQTGLACAAPKPTASARNNHNSGKSSTPTTPITNTSQDADCVPFAAPPSSTPTTSSPFSP
jgi:membrane peptidoglycan carboxypeptidase